MEVDVIRIGNSKGIRIPASMLKQCGIDKKVIIKVVGSYGHRCRFIVRW
ncbi:hypothetical protein SCACP_39720 [Sporomusa carbonis]